MQADGGAHGPGGPGPPSVPAGLAPSAPELAEGGAGASWKDPAVALQLGPPRPHWGAHARFSLPGACTAAGATDPTTRLLSDSSLTKPGSARGPGPHSLVTDPTADGERSLVRKGRARPQTGVSPRVPAPAPRHLILSGPGTLSCCLGPLGLAPPRHGTGLSVNKCGAHGTAPLRIRRVGCAQRSS